MIMIMIIMIIIILIILIIIIMILIMIKSSDTYGGKWLRLGAAKAVQPEPVSLKLLLLLFQPQVVQPCG